MEFILEVLKQFVNVVVIVAPILPLVVAATRYVGKKTKNQNLITLANRSDIIVRALNGKPFEDLTGSEKKHIAVNKLSDYANEIGIKMTPGQLEDYIQSAYELLNERSEQLAIQ